MAYFNHAFNKVFLGTKNATASTPTNGNQSTGLVGFASGFIVAGTYHTSDLIKTSTTVGASNLGIGSYGFFDPNSWTSVNNANVTGLGKVCCPLVLAATALYQKDQLAGQFTGIAPCPPNFHQGGFLGGYQESNKSKVINPKYISRFYRVDPCIPNQNVIHVGNTPYSAASGAGLGTITAGVATYTPAPGTVTRVTFTGGTGTGAEATVIVNGAGVITSIVITDAGVGYSVGDVLTPTSGSGDAPTLVKGVGTATTFTLTTVVSTGCCFQFLCDQSYSLRLDIKGSPTLRALNHNAYFETATWTGCCTPNCASCIGDPVDPTTVYIAWATQLLQSPMINPFIQIIVYDQNNVAVGGPNDIAAWCAYVPQAVVDCTAGTPPPTPGAGMTIIGAYVGTVFGDCTFYPTDFFEKEPVHIYASLVDYTGDVCAFEALCITESCCPRQGNGFGDTVLKDLILSERYQQNDFYTGMDLRIREITQGYDVTNAVNRASFFTRYYIQHNVPRFNNPSGVFDNDQYLLEIITNGIDGNLEAFMNLWTAECTRCPQLEIYSCGPCCPVPAVATTGVVGTPYSYTVAPTAGTGTAWDASPGDDAALASLGLTLGAGTGIISGAVPIAGTVDVTITVTNAQGMTILCQSLQITILP